MIEPTESESKAELDRLVNALIAIRGEIRDIEEGRADKDDNVLKNAPHPAQEVMADEWNHPYSRELVRQLVPIPALSPRVHSLCLCRWALRAFRLFLQLSTAPPSARHVLTSCTTSA